MKKLWLFVGIALLLTGCQDLVISEAEVNRKAERFISEHQRLDPFAGKLSNVVVNYDIDDIQIDFQSSAGGQVITRLSGTLAGKVRVLGRDLSLKVLLTPQLVSSLRYSDGKIYLKEPRVLDWGGGLPGVLKPHENKLETMASSYLQDVPIYTLNHSLKEKLAASVIKRISIKDDQLVFVL